MDKLKTILAFIGVAVIIAIPSFFIGLRRGQNKAQRGVKTDTLIVYRIDTIKAVQTVFLTERIVDTMWLHLTDTVTVRDSVPVIRTQREYGDSTYHAWVSGFRPELDSISVFRREKTVIVEHFPDAGKKMRWGVGIQAGYGVSIGQDGVNTAPFVGIGVYYNIFSW